VTSGGYNIYGSLKAASVFTPQTSDQSSTIAAVFGSSSPTLNASKKLAPTMTFASPVAATVVKEWIRADDEDFYNWLNTINAWPSGDTWIPGAWQNN
jgi:hypothetical protein